MQRQHVVARILVQEANNHKKAAEKGPVKILTQPKNHKGNMMKELKSHICDSEGRSENLKSLAETTAKKVVISSEVSTLVVKNYAKRWVRKQNVEFPLCSNDMDKNLMEKDILVSSIGKSSMVKFGIMGEVMVNMVVVLSLSFRSRPGQECIIGKDGHLVGITTLKFDGLSDHNLVGDVDNIRSRGQNNTILHIAAKSGKLRRLEEDDYLLRFLYEQNNEGNTPLHIAAKLGHLETVRILVEMARKIDVEQNKRLLTTENNEKDTALHEAVRHNHLEVVKLLTEEDPDLASIVNGEGDSPLFMAVDRCFYQVALHILSNAPNCSYQGRNGMNVLHVAAIRSKKRPVTLTSEEWESLLGVRMLTHLLRRSLSRRLDIEKTEFGLLVLENVQALTLEQADDLGWTPLHYAAHIGNEVLVKQFLNKDRKRLPFFRNIEGMSALHIAAKKGHDSVIRVLMESCPEVCELLDNNGRTALHIAVESRKEMAVKFFLKQAMAFQDLINLKDNKGNTALHVAATVGDFHILRILTNDSRIDKGATNKDKQTFVDIILSNKELHDTEILNIMVGLEIESVLPPRSEQKVDTIKTNEAESKKKKKDEIQIEEDEAGCQQQTNEAESKEKKKDETHVEENEEADWKPLQKMVMVSLDKKKEDLKKKMKDFSNLNLVVATIIAAATFAAAFAIPGGYNDQGLPVLYRSKEFKRFLRLDEFAFVLSTVSLLLNFILMLCKEIFAVTLVPIALAAYLTGFSLVMMVVAFAQGITAVIPRSENHNIFKKDAYLTGSTLRFVFLYFFLVVFLLALALAGLNATPRRSEPRTSVRSRFGLWS
ncbi:ankyrin repeat-containing protein At5g02620-like [Ziziphus jujuba]|uniref:Ankyrin repeat-containing protein At5g02620-like n=1 Tax=Ziziphus jujuba TaxID=326968 RepID=A0ABM4AFN4_ZIZJJ|nr:ankyrin repeat-containing protein At5g02620-like [Ziziphus jujuba]